MVFDAYHNEQGKENKLNIDSPLILLQILKTSYFQIDTEKKKEITADYAEVKEDQRNC